MSSPAEILDPRIKGELDRLNTTSDEINRLEKEIDDIRHQFRHTLTESSQRLTETGKKCIKAIHRAQPYHEAKKVDRQAHESAQDAALKYQRAVGMFRAAKETIAIAEEISMQGANKKRDFDSALQELLNHATSKLNEAEAEKLKREKEHEDTSRKYIASQKRVEQIGKKHKKSIAKSGDYYALRHSFYNRLEGMKNRMEALQRQVAMAKKQYRQALKQLEKISEEIHQSREIEALLARERSRGVGVGAESESTISDADDEAKRLSLTQLNLDLKNVLAMNEMESPSNDAASDEVFLPADSHPADEESSQPVGQSIVEELPQQSVPSDEANGATGVTHQAIVRDVENLDITSDDEDDVDAEMHKDSMMSQQHEDYFTKVTEVPSDTVDMDDEVVIPSTKNDDGDNKKPRESDSSENIVLPSETNPEQKVDLMVDEESGSRLRDDTLLASDFTMETGSQMTGDNPCKDMEIFAADADLADEETNNNNKSKKSEISSSEKLVDDSDILGDSVEL